MTKGSGIGDPGTEFCLLGPLLVRHDGAAVPIAPGRQRAVLAALLLSAGKVVALDELAEALWGAAPPPSARVTVQNYVMRLRRALGDSSRISTYPHGYAIRVADGELDLTRFEDHLSAARAAARDGAWETVTARARAGLALWRGEPLADVESDLLAARDVPRLAELRLQATELRIDADLHLGRHGEVIAGLRRLAADHPLRERLHGLLMLALYRDGRQAEALEAYTRARQILIAELGTEPGAALRELHQQILTGDPALDSPAGTAGGAADAVPDADDARPPAVPRELPAPVAHFAGRAAELAALTKLAETQDGQGPGAVVISAIGGTAGVGKTALAIQWAHQEAGRFPDGQLYVNLRGYDPDRPMPAADALAGFLRSLGVGGQDIPAEEDERAARYRSLLAGKRVLVVLDNAGSVEQVRPLLPGSPSCAVLVTSRDSLAGLVARHGARRLDLDLLPPADATRLLRDLIGERAAAGPDAVAALAHMCCRLPLALRVAAELAAARPEVTLGDLARELADQQQRLDLLDADGDPRTAVRAVFSWSHRHLSDDTARMFRLAGLHPGDSFDAYAAAALADATLGRARRMLNTLTRASLLQMSAPGRYGMHDLLRAYARELAARDGDEEPGAAQTRLFDHYLHTASAAMDTLYPAERDRRPRIPPPDSPSPPVTDPDAARAWLDAERAVLVAVTVHAAGHGWTGHATRLSATLFRYLDTCGYYAEAITIHSHASAAARRAGEWAAEATALNMLGIAHLHLGRYQEAADDLRQALALFRQAGDRIGQGRALGNLAIIHHEQGEYKEAVSINRQALAIYREIGDPSGQASALINMGFSEERQGRYALAARYDRQALAIAADIGSPHTECAALVNLGTAELRRSRYKQAADYLHRAVARSNEVGYRWTEAEALARAGDLCLLQDNPDKATRHLQDALNLYREIGSSSGEADALNSLGDVRLATGQPDHARAEYAAALALATQADDRYQQARAYRGLGQAFQVGGDPSAGRRHWQQALELYTELGTPEADQVRAQLDETAPQSRPTFPG